MINKIKIASLLFLFSMSLNAQSLRAYEAAASSAIDARDYTGALGYYKIILEEAGDTKISNYYLAAEAARMAKAFDYSESYYQYVAEKDLEKEYTDARYWLAKMQKSQGKYELASANFEKYAADHSDKTSEKIEKALKESEVCKWAKSVVENPSDTDYQRLDENVNTGYAEFAPVFHKGSLYYSSVRYATGSPDDGPALSKIMIAENEEFGVTLKGEINLDDLHAANASFNSDGSKMYYTICKEDVPGERICNIYSRSVEGDGFSEPVMLPEQVNKNGANNTQPNIGLDAKGNNYLFFASNRNGGKGGMDIWVSKIDEEGNFEEATNLESINTMGNEVTPFFHKRSSKLYYSTDGRKSLGGLDVYSSKMIGGKWMNPVHGGYPLNSPMDDAYLSLNERGDLGYFSSNRPGAACLDTVINCVCNDIYKTDRAIVDLLVNTYNAITKEPLVGTEVSLIPKQYDKEVQLDEKSHEYYFGLDFDNSYKIAAIKDGYTSVQDEVDTYGDKSSRTLEKDLFLTPNIDIDALVFDQRSGEPLNGVTVELLALADVELLSSKVELDKNDFNFPLDWLKKYRIIAKKEGYISDTVDVFTTGIPVVPTNLLENMFLCRQPFANYPFIALYFDNDFPKIAGKDSRLAVNDYETTFKNYTEEQKRSEFLNAFNRDEEKNEIRNFFDDVDEGYVRLGIFAENLIRLLSDENIRDTVIVTLKGYASPRSTPEYNHLLTERRINSMDQFLGLYKGGLLRQFLDDGRIRIVREPYGEEKAVGGSEDINDRKASVYAVDASRERRLEIIRVTTSKFVCPTEPQKF